VSIGNFHRIRYGTYGLEDHRQNGLSAVDGGWAFFEEF
jgi:hypothetical protein